MGSKLMFSGITAVVALPLFGVGQSFILVGAVIAVIGAILYDLDK